MYVESLLNGLHFSQDVVEPRTNLLINESAISIEEGGFMNTLIANLEAGEASCRAVCTRLLSQKEVAAADRFSVRCGERAMRTCRSEFV